MDEEEISPTDVGVNRMQFLLETLEDLDLKLSENLNINLVIAKGSSYRVIQKLFYLYDV